MNVRGLGLAHARRTVLLLVAALVLVSGAVAAPAGEARAVAPRFADGTAVREENSFLIYKIVGGAKVWFVNATEFYGLGYTLDRVVVVPRGTLEAVPNVPRDGTLVRERSSFAVYLMEGGKRRWISSREAFDAAGFTLGRVQVVANGALGGIPAGQDFRATPLDVGASAAGVKCDPTRMPFGHARARRADGNVVGIPDEGWRTYYVSVESLLYRCGGYVRAVHHVFVDSRWLPMGFTLVLKVSTRRSDGKWYGKWYEATTSKNFGLFTASHIRGVGGGLRLTDVHVKHFPAPGQASFFKASTAKSVYGPWNGPEAKPGPG
jgi:hypothetical protein